MSTNDLDEAARDITSRNESIRHLIAHSLDVEARLAKLRTELDAGRHALEGGAAMEQALAIMSGDLNLVMGNSSVYTHYALGVASLVGQVVDVVVTRSGSTGTGTGPPTIRSWTTLTSRSLAPTRLA